MDDTLLDFGLGITSRDRLGEAGQVIHTGDQDVWNAAVLQLVQDAQPELRRFVLADHHVSRFVHDRAILLDFKVDGVQKYDGIHALQGRFCHSLMSGTILFVTLEMRVGDTSMPYSCCR